MKKLLLAAVLMVFFLTESVFGADISLTARDLMPDFARGEIDLYINSSGKKYISNVSYIQKHQAISISIKNNSKSPVTINPNHFTLVSSKMRSYPYSSETHNLKNKLSYLNENPINHVKLYPGTTTEGFLLFDKRFENEYPKKLYFDNSKIAIEVDVALDPKSKYK